jgi:hypothetical protein
MTFAQYSGTDLAANPILRREREGVPHGPERATKGDEDAISRSNGINGLERVFRGAVPSRTTGSGCCAVLGFPLVSAAGAVQTI